METTTIPCELCGVPTPMLGTRRCNRCWELENRIRFNPALARSILSGLQPPRARVVHCKRDAYDVYVGRPSAFGNPFPSGPRRSRLQSIIQFRAWVVEQPALMDRIRGELRGKVLGCWCAPRPCHGSVLARLADTDKGAMEAVQAYLGEEGPARSVRELLECLDGYRIAELADAGMPQAAELSGLLRDATMVRCGDAELERIMEAAERYAAVIPTVRGG